MYMMYFNDIHLSFFYPQSSLSIHLQISCSFLFLFLTTHWVQSKTCMYISVEPVTRIWGHTSKEIWRSLSQQPPRSTANSFSARGWGLWTTLVSWKCWNTDWLAPVQSFTDTYGTELCADQDWSQPQVCSSQLSSPSSGSRILSAPSPVLHPKPGMGWGWRNADADVSLKAKHTWPLGLNTDQLWFSIDERTHEKRPLRSRLRAAPI